MTTKWKDVLEIENYNLDLIRKNNVTIGSFQQWLDLFRKFNINVGILDINLYAIEFASRSASRYGVRYLPKITNNSLSGHRYDSLLKYPCEKIIYSEIKEMLVYIIKKTKPSTLEKWLVTEV